LIDDFIPPKPPKPNVAVAMMFKFSLMFDNVQSLNKHILDVKFDQTVLSASIISLVET